MDQDTEALLREAVFSIDEGQQRDRLVRLVKSEGFVDSAFKHCLEQLGQCDDPVGACCRFGQVLAANGMPAAALRALSRALEHDPDCVPALVSTGLLHAENGDLETAREMLLDAVAIDDSSADAHNALGIVLGRMGRAAEARDCFLAAAERDPGHVESRISAALAFRDLGIERSDESIQWVRRALAIDPSSLRASDLLSALLAEQGRRNEAIAECDRYLALDKDALLPHWRRCISLLPAVYHPGDDVGEIRQAYGEALRSLSRRIERKPPRSAQEIARLVELDQPFYLPYQGENDAELQRIYGSLVVSLLTKWRESVGLSGLTMGRRRGRKIRLAIVSSFVRHHSVWHANIRGFAQHLPRDRFEVFCYQTTLQDRSALPPEARLFDRYVDGNRSLLDWTLMIQNDAPDVIYYPELGMDTMSIRLAGQRLAPVQVVGWGHPETSGLPTIDHFISGELLEPGDGREHYTEELHALPGTGTCYVPIGVPASEPDSMVRGTLGRGRVNYLSCQSVFKYLPIYDSIFCEIAMQVPGCQFVFVEDVVAARKEIFRQRIRNSFASRGVDPEAFVRFIPPLPLPKFLGLLKSADVYLDTIGFSGYSTAMMAAEHGCPIVTVEGRLMRGRLASAVLRQIGVAETIARDPAEYVDIASRLGNADHMRRSLSSRMSQGLGAALDDRRPVEAFATLLERWTGMAAG